MIKVKKPNTNLNEPKSITCENCGAEIEYLDSDTEVGLWGCKGFNCPECGDFIFCSDRVAEPSYPTTFWRKSKNVKNLSDEEVNELLKDVKEGMASREVGEFTIVGTGDTVVIGLKFNDEDDYYVCRNAEEDCVWHTEDRT